MRRFDSAGLRAVARAVTVAAVAGLLAGCVSQGEQGPMAAMAYAPAQTGTVAFESVDGPPPQVFDRMVGILNSESQLRNLNVVTREAPAAYRVRSYMAAQIHRGRTVISWVWDVYDGSQQRALRLSGEEQTGKSGKDAWGAADDMVLRKIAQAGFSGLASLSGTGPTPSSEPVPTTAPPSDRPAVAQADAPQIASNQAVSGSSQRLGFAAE